MTDDLSAEATPSLHTFEAGTILHFHGFPIYLVNDTAVGITAQNLAVAKNFAAMKVGEVSTTDLTALERELVEDARKGRALQA